MCLRSLPSSSKILTRTNGLNIKIYVLLVLLLGFRLATYLLFPNQQFKPGTTMTLVTVLDREPEIQYGRQLIRLEGLTIYARIVPELYFGDRIEISGLVECGNRGLDCGRLVVNKPTIRTLEQNSSNWWVSMGFTIRSRFVQVYQSILNHDQANLLSGIVLGNLGLDRQFKDKLANVGLTHVVAASGMNVSLFSGFVLWLCSVLKMKRSYKAILTIIMILFYSTITGFAPPIVRAAIMAVTTLVGQVLGRQRWGVMGLLLSAYLMLWVDPSMLINASFLLSFSAMTGQIILSGFLTQLPNKKGIVIETVSFLTKDLIASLAAIIATFPIVMMFFAKFSLVSVFTNAIVLWTVEPLMILGAVAGILGMVWHGGAQMVALPTGVLLSFFLWVVDAFGRDSRFLLRLTGIDWTFTFGYYLVFAATILWWRGWRAEKSLAK